MVRHFREWHQVAPAISGMARTTLVNSIDNTHRYPKSHPFGEEDRDLLE